MGFPRQEFWSGLPFPPPGDLSDPGIKPASSARAGGFFIAEPPGKPPKRLRQPQKAHGMLRYCESFLIRWGVSGTGQTGEDPSLCPQEKAAVARDTEHRLLLSNFPAPHHTGGKRRKQVEESQGGAVTQGPMLRRAWGWFNVLPAAAIIQSLIILLLLLFWLGWAFVAVRGLSLVAPSLGLLLLVVLVLLTVVASLAVEHKL